jgi:hypothetical protein
MLCLVPHPYEVSPIYIGKELDTKCEEMKYLKA